MTYTNQPARQENIEAIVSYCREGIKDDVEHIGIELEHTLVHHDGSQVTYDEPHGARDILDDLQKDFSSPMIDEGNIVGISDDEGHTVTLEPAAQLEISAGPFKNIAEAHESLQSFETALLDVCAPYGIEVLTPGYHPTTRAIDLKMIPKQRYTLMNEYLGAISMYGICMMRGSASTQIAIDYSSEKDCLRKLRLAQICAPLFALMCDNAPVFEGSVRRHQLVRTKIWQHCDPDRCGAIPGAVDSDFSLSDYATYVLDTPAIVDIHDTSHLCTRTFGEVYAETPMTTNDVEHALSMLFNDVRLKRYIEIRPADAMPLDYVVAYASFIKGLFYGPGSLDAMDALFHNISQDDIDKAKDALMADGYDALVYGYPASVLTDELSSIAQSGLSAEERRYATPLATLIDERTTLADRALKEKGFDQLA